MSQPSSLSMVQPFSQLQSVAVAPGKLSSQSLIIRESSSLSVSSTITSDGFESLSIRRGRAGNRAIGATVEGGPSTTKMSMPRRLGGIAFSEYHGVFVRSVESGA